MKSAAKRQTSRNIDITGYVISSSSGQTPAVTTLVIAMEPASSRKPLAKAGLALVNVQGPLADLCRNELRFGDQIQVEGTVRLRPLRAASGVLHSLPIIEASMVTPIHPELVPM